MKRLRFPIAVFAVSFLLLFFNCCTGNKGKKEESQAEKTGDFYIGWSSVDITPDGPVLLHGQHCARISEGVMDPITATALAIESGRGPTSKKAILISCDLLLIKDNLRDNVRRLLKASLPELGSDQIILNATHTHTGPLCGDTDSKSVYGIELDAVSPSTVTKYISECIAEAALQAWKNRNPAGISYGLGHAVVGHNRVQVVSTGKSQMYGNTNKPEFSHIEGYEDHSVNLLYTWDKDNRLTGVVINIACTAQNNGGESIISADFWHDTRLEVRRRLGKDVNILPQLSAAGEQTPYIPVGGKAEERMQRIMFADSIKTGRDGFNLFNLKPTGRGSIGRRKQIAFRIADAVTSVFPYMKDNIEWDPVFDHRMELVELSRMHISIEDVNEALKEAERLENEYEQYIQEIKENPAMQDQPRWYTNATKAYGKMVKLVNVQKKYELQRQEPKMPVEVHVLRLGDVVMATNRFELYLDYGMRIKARSPAVQTFLVQHTGSGSYLPTSRSIAGGAYGAVPFSCLIGPEGGQEFVEKTLELINDAWEKE